MPQSEEILKKKLNASTPSCDTSHLLLRPMGFNVLGNQSHQLRRCYPASGRYKNLPISSGFSPTVFNRDASSALLHLVMVEFHLFKRKI